MVSCDSRRGAGTHAFPISAPGTPGRGPSSAAPQDGVHSGVKPSWGGRYGAAGARGRGRDRVGSHQVPGTGRPPGWHRDIATVLSQSQGNSPGKSPQRDVRQATPDGIRSGGCAGPRADTGGRKAPDVEFNDVFRVFRVPLCHGDHAPSSIMLQQLTAQSGCLPGPAQISRSQKSPHCRVLAEHPLPLLMPQSGCAPRGRLTHTSLAAAAGRGPGISHPA